MKTPEFFDWLTLTSVQATVIAALVLAVQLLFRHRLSPAWRHGLWFLVVARLVMPHLPESSASVFNAARRFTGFTQRTEKTPPPVSPNHAVIVAFPALQTSHPTVSSKQSVEAPIADSAAHDHSTPENAPVNRLALLWLAGVAILALRLATQSVRFVWALRRSRAIRDPALETILAGCRKSMGLRREVTLWETDLVRSPALCGLLRPKLLLPRGMAGAFTAGELRAVFLHELAHLKRGDLWVSWILSALEIMHWFNPAIWFAFHRMRAEREVACDALALSAMGLNESRNYGRTIIRVLESAARLEMPAGVLGMLESRGHLAHRIRMIAGYPTTACSPSIALALFLGLGWITLTEARSTSPAAPADPTAAASQIANAIEADEKGEPPGNLPRMTAEEARPVADVPRSEKPLAVSMGISTENPVKDSIHASAVEPVRAVSISPGNSNSISPPPNPAKADIAPNILEKPEMNLLVGALPESNLLTLPDSTSSKDAAFRIRIDAKFLKFFGGKPPPVALDEKHVISFEWLDIVPPLAVATQPGIAPLARGSPSSLTRSILSNLTPNELPFRLGRIFSSAQFNSVVQSLEQRQGVTIVTAPTVITVNGGGAELSIQESRTIVTGGVLEGHGAPMTNQVTVGPTLGVIPQIGADGRTIQLEVVAHITEFQGYDDPTPFLSREQVAAATKAGKKPESLLMLPRVQTWHGTMSTNVANGETMMFGGGTPGRVVKQVSQTPVLGAVPVLGRLFRTTTMTSARDYYVIFVTATIVDDAGNPLHRAE